MHAHVHEYASMCACTCLDDTTDVYFFPLVFSGSIQDPEEVILRRVRYSWVSLAVLSTCLLGMPFHGGIDSGLRLYKTVSLVN